ncbi:phosphate ABC transporter substrate-binding protein PstS family protein [Methylovulum psychrotolerans]|uniref:PstS family phosphate ABC transporter substrate-binding protein n=1 Tax=Methylovulum psychrotolerans TaxID=1704499 RepID=UPI001BFF378E|nr:phosphate ABC transporter substrate-binding protein PstS family protein [Methylovulum psychrotolerans]MBT9098805.1 phosphate ABC transporter substrate-binding protein PstS family protein [Methylovulum psychrotolerans]
MNLSFKTKPLLLAMSFVSLLAASAVGQAVQTVESGVPEYEKASGVAGNLSSVGSDTLANQMTLWAEAFNRFYPNVNIQIQAAGSSTAPPALTEGTANFGPMSREMKDEELHAFEAKYGYKPTMVPVAVDALAVFVNKDNPIKGLSVEQVDAIFSSTRKCGYATDISAWGDVGVASWKDKSIQLYGRNSVSGTYGYFKEHALCKGDFKSNVNEQPGSASVVQSVSTSINGIGYSGLGYVTSGIKAVPLAKKGAKGFVAATPENALAGKYPLARYLYVYVNKKPNQPLAPLENEFIKMVLSKTGQEIVIKDGYIPLPAKVIKKVLATLK